MEEKDIIKIWKKGFDKSYNDKPITMETIENIVKLRSGKVARNIKWNLYFSLAFYIGGIFLTAYTSVLYKSHLYLKWVLPACFFILIMLLIQNIFLLKNYKELKSLDISLRERVSGIIRYFRGTYSLWQLFYPLGVIILTVCVTLLVDYQNGIFRINHPFEFLAVLVIMYAFIYFPLQYTRNVYLEDLENCLKNMDEQEYSSIEKTVRKHRIFMILFVIGLGLLVLGGFVAWFLFANQHN